VGLRLAVGSLRLMRVGAGTTDGTYGTHETYALRRSHPGRVLRLQPMMFNGNREPPTANRQLPTVTARHE
jgi:hypothetical protein